MRTIVKQSEDDKLHPRTAASGFYQAIASANVDPGGVLIPVGARALMVWFETSASDPTRIGGRVGFNGAAAAVAHTATDGTLGYQPDIVAQYPIESTVSHVHVAAPLAGAVAKGQWLY